MKKIIFMLSLIVILVFSSVTAFAESTNEIVIAIDSSKVEFNDDLGFPFVDENNRTMVPFMATLVKCGATVTWNNENRTAVAVKGDITVEVPVEKNYILKNGVKIDTDTTAKIVNGRTYLPIRAVIEAFGSEVQWDQSLNTVVITTEPIDAKAIFTAANDKSYNWKNYDADVTMDVSMAMPDDKGAVQTMNMKMNMYMTLFMNPMKAKISADMVMDVLGEKVSQPVLDMYLSLDDKSYTTYMGMNDSTGKLTWMKSKVEDEMFSKLMNYDEKTIKANKELMAKYIKDVKYFGKYTDKAGKTLLKMEYSMSTDIYKDLLGGYVKELSASTNEQEKMTAEMLKGLVEGNMGDLAFVVYIDEASGEIVKYEIDLGAMISKMVSGMTASMKDVTKEDLAVLNGLKATMVMEIKNVNAAKEFEIPAEALNAKDMTEMMKQLEETTTTNVKEEKAPQ